MAGYLSADVTLLAVLDAVANAVDPLSDFWPLSLLFSWIRHRAARLGLVKCGANVL
jgi:hypothetical protein